MEDKSDNYLTGYANKSHFITDYILINKKLKKRELSFVNLLFELLLTRIKLNYFIDQKFNKKLSNSNLQEFIMILVSINVIKKANCYIPRKFKQELSNLSNQFILCLPELKINIEAGHFLSTVRANITRTKKIENKIKIADGYKDIKLNYLKQKISYFLDIENEEKFMKELIVQSLELS